MSFVLISATVKIKNRQRAFDLKLGSSERSTGSAREFNLLNAVGQ